MLTHKKVVFELIGMLATSLHIKNSVFRMLPNPTQHRWDTADFSLVLIMKAFVYELDEGRMSMHSAAPRNHTFIQRRLYQSAQAILEHTPQIPDRTPDIHVAPDIDLLNLLHESVADATEVLTARNAREQTMRDRTSSGAPNVSHEEREILQSRRRKLTLLILRNHIQVILAGLNEGIASGPPVDIIAGGGLTPTPTWEELDHIPPELKEAKLMEIYFQIARPRVVVEAEKLAGDLDVSVPADSVEDESGGYLNNIPLWKVENVSCEDIWCTLVFRSICWLMLHDFHADDVQIPKSDLFGSRLPVYIA